MRARRWWVSALMLALGLLATEASARALSLEIRTDRGHDGVYNVGDPIAIETRASDDGYLLVYEIDAEGYVHLLFPEGQGSSRIEGGRTYRLPERDSDLELVARGPVGQGYIVAIAAYERFRDLPWYLRPYDAKAEEMGYYGEPNEEEGVTAEGRIVGDPFVAMERIRRAVLDDPENSESFATAYTGYYVGHEVRYPRYLCYDCHRPGYWAWWSGFDPYYAQCRAFDFRVNWSWTWGPSYWSGFVPYYMYVYRNDCPPRYRHGSGRAFSSWDGWRRWRSLWDGPLRRYKSDPPPASAHDPKFDPGRRWPKDGELPPGYLGRNRRTRGDVSRDPIARNQDDGRRTGDGWRRRDRGDFGEPGRQTRDPESGRWERPRSPMPRDPQRPRGDAERPGASAPRTPRWNDTPARPERPSERTPRMRWVDPPTPGRGSAPQEPRDRRFDPSDRSAPRLPRTPWVERRQEDRPAPAPRANPPAAPAPERRWAPDDRSHGDGARPLERRRRE